MSKVSQLDRTIAELRTKREAVKVEMEAKLTGYDIAIRELQAQAIKKAPRIRAVAGSSEQGS